MIVNELTEATQGLVRNFAHFLSRLLVMLLIVLVGWVIAHVARRILRSILYLVKFDRLSENTGAAQLLSKAALPSSTELLSRFVFWVTWLGFVLLGVSSLGIVGLQAHAAKFFLFLPRVFVALLFLFVGLLAANFFSRSALLWGVNADLPSPRLLSAAVRILIIIFTGSAVFEELGLAEGTVRLAFGIVLAAGMLAIAIAFGLGGQHLARQLLEERFGRDPKDGNKREKDLSPL